MGWITRRVVMVALASGGLALWTAPSTAQPDAKVLVGKWEGEYQPVQRGTANTARTLIVESVTAAGGGWNAKARYGVTGQRLPAVEIPVENHNGQLRLRFATGAGSQVDLRLHGDKHLIGTLSPTGASQRAKDLPLKLEKVE